MGFIDKIKQQYGSKVIKPVERWKVNINKLVPNTLTTHTARDPNWKPPPPGIKKMSKEDNQRLIEALRNMRK